jgi:hypothetical protein
VPVRTRGGPGFHLCFAVGLASTAIAAHLCSSWYVAGVGEDRLGRVISIFCWGTLPYLVLVLLTWVIRSPLVLLITTVLLAGTDYIAVHGALFGNSTSGLGLLVQPAVALLVILPAATVAGFVLRLLAAWERRRAKRGQDGWF